MKTSVHTKSHSYMFIEALVIIAQRWKQLTCPSTDEWLNEIYVHTIQFYFAIKRNGVLRHVYDESIYMKCPE